MEKFTCLESTARLAVQPEYAMTYPLENRSHGSLEERWSISLGIALESAARRARRAALLLPQDKCGLIFHGLSAHVLCHIEEWETSHQKRL